MDQSVCRRALRKQGRSFSVWNARDEFSTPGSTPQGFQRNSPMATAQKNPPILSLSKGVKSRHGQIAAGSKASS
jgi:hypothetical protein